MSKVNKTPTNVDIDDRDVSVCLVQKKDFYDTMRALVNILFIMFVITNALILLVGFAILTTLGNL